MNCLELGPSRFISHNNDLHHKIHQPSRIVAQQWEKGKSWESVQLKVIGKMCHFTLNDWLLTPFDLQLKHWELYPEAVCHSFCSVLA